MEINPTKRRRIHHQNGTSGWSQEEILEARLMLVAESAWLSPHGMRLRSYSCLIGAEEASNKSPCPKVISLEWGLVSGCRFYLLSDQSKDKI